MIDAPTPGNPDPVEAYLDSLLARLHGTSGDVRRALTECESHLRDAVDALSARGVPAERAMSEALARFGPARDVARAFNRRNQPRAAMALVPGLAVEAWRMLVLGLAAIAVSAPLTWLLTRLFGVRAVFADSPGVRYDAASCAHFLAVQPSAHGCLQAALLEGRDDGYVLRAAAAILAGVLFVGLQGVRRRKERLGPGTAVPELLPLTVGATLFGAAGVWLLGYGVNRVLLGAGPGQWLVAGAISLVIGAGYVTCMWRQVTGAPGAAAQPIRTSITARRGAGHRR